jgi:hypothetical protein
LNITSAKWCGVLAAFLLAAPILSATAVGEGDAKSAGRNGITIKAATIIYPSPSATAHSQGALAVVATPTPSPVATPTPPPTPVPTPVPPPPTPLPTPIPTVPADFCADAVSLNVIDAELIGAVQAGTDSLARYFGCQKFRIDGTGLPVKFGEISSVLNAKFLGYAYSAPDVYEIWINRDCWGVVEGWDGDVAHELGHYLGWTHGDDHPYMWLPPPPGSYARPGDAAIVCY